MRILRELKMQKVTSETYSDSTCHISSSPSLPILSRVYIHDLTLLIIQ